MTLRVVPEGLAAANAVVEALAARLAAVHAMAAPLITAVAPPAADPVSLRASVALNVHGIEHAAKAAEGIRELGSAGIAVGDSGSSYLTGDSLAASRYLATSGEEAG